MRSVLGLLLCVSAASAQAAMAFAAADQTTIVNTMNSLRSRMAKGTEKWVGKGRNYPQSIRTYQLSWAAGLATASVARLNLLDPSQPLSAQSDVLKASDVPFHQGETHYGIYSTSSNAKTTAQMFGTAWNTAWYNFIKKSGLPGPGLVYNSTGVHPDKNKNFAYQIAAGQTRTIGCAYRNFTTGAAAGTFAVLCRYNARGLFDGNPIYPEGVTCSGCAKGNPPATVCVTATGLCA
ncbi:unnamed protein product, partial [Mesorhabditis belari]|uniref:SCP domain-containing protein n=1 Tax=Mesorhabditis belari TaxID=2138241 RepID=A0AAF3EMS5_9BILA